MSQISRTPRPYRSERSRDLRALRDQRRLEQLLTGGASVDPEQPNGLVIDGGRQLVVSVVADGLLVLSFGGEHDLASAGELERTFQSPPCSEADRLVVDLRGCVFLDARALGVVVRAARDMAARGGRFLLLIPLAGPPRRILELSDDTWVATATSMEEAIERLGSRSTTVGRVAAGAVRRLPTTRSRDASPMTSGFGLPVPIRLHSLKGFAAAARTRLSTVWRPTSTISWNSKTRMRHWSRGSC
jgi:anti-anti-sigma regulatory factor